jgi:hypothetical protein
LEMSFIISSKNLVLSILNQLLLLKKRDTLWWIANFKGISHFSFFLFQLLLWQMCVINTIWHLWLMN